MNCKECGAEIPEGSSVCDSCGASQSGFRLKVDKPEPKQETPNNEQMYKVNYPEHRTQSQQPGMQYQQPGMQYHEPFNSRKKSFAPDFDVYSIIAAVLLAVSPFLTYVSAFRVSVTANDYGWGKWILILGILAGVVAFFDMSPAVIGVGAVALLISIIKAMDFLCDTYGILKKGIGFYLMFIASIGLMITGYLRQNKL